MKNFIPLTAVALASLYSIPSWSDTSYVYCVNGADRTDWYWLEDDDENPVLAQGKWKREDLTTVRFFKVFVLSDAIKGECQSGYLIQPATSSTSHWHLFQEKSDGTCLKPGFVDIYRKGRGKFPNVTTGVHDPYSLTGFTYCNE